VRLGAGPGEVAERDPAQLGEHPGRDPHGRLARADQLHRVPGGREHDRPLGDQGGLTFPDTTHDHPGPASGQPAGELVEVGHTGGGEERRLGRRLQGLPERSGVQHPVSVHGTTDRPTPAMAWRQTAPLCHPKVLG
jgi:hypothetical protein